MPATTRRTAATAEWSLLCGFEQLLSLSQARNMSKPGTRHSSSSTSLRLQEVCATQGAGTCMTMMMMEKGGCRTQCGRYDIIRLLYDANRVHPTFLFVSKECFGDIFPITLLGARVLFRERLDDFATIKMVASLGSFDRVCCAFLAQHQVFG